MSTPAPGAPVAVFPTRIYGGGTDTGLSRQIRRDPRRAVLINTVLDGAAAPITLIQDWNPEARK